MDKKKIFNKKTFNPPHCPNNKNASFDITVSSQDSIKHNSNENISNNTELVLELEKKADSLITSTLPNSSETDISNIKKVDSLKSQKNTKLPIKPSTQTSINSLPIISTPKQSKFKKPASSCPETITSISESTTKNQKATQSSSKVQHKINKPGLSLTNSQYDDIFNSVLNTINKSGETTINTKICLNYNTSTNDSNKENECFANNKTINEKQLVPTIKTKTNINNLAPKRMAVNTKNSIKQLKTFEKIQNKNKNMKTNERPVKDIKRLKTSNSMNRNKNIKDKVSSDKSKLRSQIELSQKFALSQPPRSFTHRQRLEWLQERRGVGTWVQCSRPTCKKWRYLDYIKEPIDVPEEWFCSMNQDKEFASCSTPEKGPSLVVEDDLIHNIYTAGSIVWALLDGFPWWPAMVDDCPETEEYYWLDGYSDIPTHYHVVFFDSKTVSRAWIKPSCLKPFKTGNEFTKTKCGKTNYKERIFFAKNVALEALNCDILTRLRKYSFIARWKGPINDPINLDSDSSSRSSSSNRSSSNNDSNLNDTETLENISLSLNDTNETVKSKYMKKHSKNIRLSAKIKTEPVKKNHKKLLKTDNNVLETQNNKSKIATTPNLEKVNSPSDISLINIEPKIYKNIEIEKSQNSVSSISKQTTIATSEAIEKDTNNDLIDKDTNVLNINDDIREKETDISQLDNNNDNFVSLSQHSSVIFDSNEDLTVSEEQLKTKKSPSIDEMENVTKNQNSNSINSILTLSLYNTIDQINNDKINDVIDELKNFSQESLPFDPEI